MAAAVFHGDERITIERIPLPRVGEGEVLMRVGKTALCGSDFKLWHKGAEFTAGHEIFGRVEQPGHRLHDTRCCVYIPLHCGHCAVMPARRHADVSGNVVPHRLEPAGGLCRICTGSGELPAAGSRGHRGSACPAPARHDRYIGACRPLRRTSHAAKRGRFGIGDRRRSRRAWGRVGAADAWLPQHPHLRSK